MYKYPDNAEIPRSKNKFKKKKKSVSVIEKVFIIKKNHSWYKHHWQATYLEYTCCLAICLSESWLGFSLFVSEQSFTSSDSLEAVWMWKKWKQRRFFPGHLNLGFEDLNYLPYESELRCLVWNRTAFSLQQARFAWVACFPWDRISNAAHVHVSHIGTLYLALLYLSLEVFIQ